MYLGKIISSFLLLTYSLGFSHNLVPHCAGHESENETSQITSNQDKGCHQNHHHNHDHQESQDGILDSLTCLWYDLEHQTPNCDIDHCFTKYISNNYLYENVNAKFIVAFIAVFVDFTYKKDVIHYGEEEKTVFSNPSIAHKPLRGPPYFSC